MIRSGLRQLSTTSARFAEISSPVVTRPRKIGAFRGGFVGFLLGTSLTGFGAYYYLFDEYRNANGAVLLDVVQLNDSIRRLESHVLQLEKQIPTQQNKSA